MKAKILLIEDDPAICELLHQNLRFEGYEVQEARAGNEGLRLAQAGQADLILLDLMLPRMSGIEVCKQLRAQGNKVPIIMLTARDAQADIVRGLKTGADDYVTKPFDLMELLARIESVLRRTISTQVYQDHYQLGDLQFDFVQHTLTQGDRVERLTRQESLLLRYLVHHEGKILSREQIMQDVWGHDELYSFRTIDTHITKLRQKIEAKPSRPRYILTVHRVGYRFVVGRRD